MTVLKPRTSAEISEMVTFNKMGQAIEWVRLDEAKPIEDKLGKMAVRFDRAECEIAELKEQITSECKHCYAYVKNCQTCIDLRLKKIAEK